MSTWLITTRRSVCVSIDAGIEVSRHEWHVLPAVHWQCWKTESGACWTLSGGWLGVSVYLSSPT